MKKTLFLLAALSLCATGCGNASSSSAEGMVNVTDMVGRIVSVKPGSYKKVVCIGAGALRLYSYVGDLNALAGVEDIDNMTVEGRPSMFDGIARPYQIAGASVFDKLPSCGIGGPKNQKAEEEKILACAPDLIISEYADVEKCNALQKKVGAPVLNVQSANKFEDSAKLLGTVLGTSSRANYVVQFRKDQMAAISARIDQANLTKPKGYIAGLGNWGTADHFSTSPNYEPFQVARINNVVTPDIFNTETRTITPENFVAKASEMEFMVFDSAAVAKIRAAGYDFSTCKAFQTGNVYLQMGFNVYYTNIETALINTWFISKSAYPSLFEDISIEAKANEITMAFNRANLYDAIKAKPLSYGGYQKIENPAQFFAKQ